MRVFLLLLRVGVFLLALAGVGGAGFLGYKGWENITQKHSLEDARKQLAAARALVSPGGLITAETVRKSESEVERLSMVARAYPFLLAGAVIGLLGGVLALVGRTNSGAVLMLLTLAGPGVIFPNSLLFLSPLGAAGLGALFVSFLAWITRPKPGAAAPRAEDEDPQPTRSAKRKSAREDEDEELAITTKPTAKQARDLDQDEEEPPSKPASKRKSDFEEEEEPARPAKKASPKRKRD